MLGMCRRPFLHNLTSKNQLTQSHEDDTHVLQPPHQIVIGFELGTDSNKSLHAQACESPRSVLEPQHLCFRAHRQQSRSPCSPISALRSSLSDHRRSPEVDGLCLKVSIKAEEDAYHSLLKSDHVACDIVDGVDACQSGAAAACKLDCARTLRNQQWNSHSRSRDGACQGSDDNPYIKSILSRDCCEDDEDEDKDEEIDVDSQKSIFSTASPVSNNPMWDRPAAADFLSKCFLCRRGLQGKDIYMYRGDRAFCSQECRYQQIVVDRRR